MTNCLVRRTYIVTAVRSRSARSAVTGWANSRARRDVAKCCKAKMLYIVGPVRACCAIPTPTPPSPPPSRWQTILYALARVAHYVLVTKRWWYDEEKTTSISQDWTKQTVNLHSANNMFQDVCWLRSSLYDIVPTHCRPSAYFIIHSFCFSLLKSVHRMTPRKTYAVIPQAYSRLKLSPYFATIYHAVRNLLTVTGQDLKVEGLRRFSGVVTFNLKE